MWTSSASSAAAMMHEARQAAEIGEVEGAGMGRTVGADQAGAVDARNAPAAAGWPRRGQPDRRRAAERSSRSADERLVALGRKPGRESDGVLLGDADVESAGRKPLAENIEAGARTAWLR